MVSTISKQKLPIRILFLIDSFRMGGAERITASLLPAFANESVTPILCTLNRLNESPQLLEPVHQAGIPLYNLNAKRLLDLKALQKLLSLLRKEKIQLIHAQLQDSNIFAAIASRFTGIPAITTRHLIDDPSSNLWYKIRNKLEIFTTRTCITKLIAVSDATKENYIKAARINSNRIKTIYNGIDLEKFYCSSNKKILRKKLNLPVKGFLVTMVSVLRPGKGHETAIKAMHEVVDAQLLMVGKGKPEFNDAIKNEATPLNDRIHLLGQRIDIPEILAACDLLILPSENEALPTVLIEAGASSLPAIASDVGGCKEIIQHDKTGLLVQPGDHKKLAESVNYLLSDTKKTQQMGKAAADFVNSRFSLPVQVEKLTTLYQEVINEIPPSP